MHRLTSIWPKSSLADEAEASKARIAQLNQELLGEELAQEPEEEDLDIPGADFLQSISRSLVIGCMYMLP